MGCLTSCSPTPTRTAALTRYYAQRRQEAKEQGLPGAQLLFDTYLFEKAPQQVLEETYGDVRQVMEHPEEKPAGWQGFLSRNFGVLLLRREEDVAYEKRRADYVRVRAMMDDLAGKPTPCGSIPSPRTSAGSWWSP